jgi:hypothetical protein
LQKIANNKSQKEVEHQSTKLMLEDWQTVYAHAKAKFEKAKEALDVVQQFMEDFNNFVIVFSSGVSIIELIEIEKKHK